jgi:hypothetical protein
LLTGPGVELGMKLLPYDARHIRKKTTTGALDLGHTRAVVLDIFEEEFHAQRVMSIANAVAGALKAAGAGIHAIGQGYAELAQIDPKHGVKQVDRLLSNSAVRVDDALAAWCRYAVGDHSSIVIALDWTEFEPDSHSTLFAALVTTKGRALPLAWRTVTREKLKGSQTEIEERFIEDLHNWLPKATAITVLADRGFAKMSLCKLLSVLGWDYVIRCKQDYLVTDSSGHTCKIGDLIPAKGRIGWVTDALVTAQKVPVPAVVATRAKDMKEPWCLLTTLREQPPRDVVTLYGRRFTVEETFRDTKDINFGMGLSATHIKSAARRDRLLLLLAIAHALLTLLGAASEKSGMDRALKSNTSKKRQHSLFRQGRTWYRMLPGLRDERRIPLLTAFDEILRENKFFSYALGLHGPIDAAI